MRLPKRFIFGPGCAYGYGWFRLLFRSRAYERAKTLALLLALSMEASRSVALKPTAVSIVFYRELM